MSKPVYKFLLIICGYFNCFPSIGQQSKTDSLWQVWNNQTLPDTTRLKAINQIIWDNYLYTQPDSALYFARLQYDLAKKNGLKDKLAMALNNCGACYYFKSNYDSAISFYTKSIEIYRSTGNKKGLSAELGNIGVIYDDLGDYPKALGYYFKAIRINKELSNKKNTAANYGNIGSVYYSQMEYPKAMMYHKKALKLNREIGNKRGMANNFGNIGILLWAMGDYDKALNNSFKSLHIFKELNDKNNIATGLVNIGNIYKDQRQNKQALNYYKQSLTISREIGNLFGCATSLGNMGLLYKLTGNYKKAEKYLKEAILISDSLDVLSLQMDQHQSIASLYETLAQLAMKGKGTETGYSNTAELWHRSLEHYKAYSTLKDSIYNEEKSKEIGKVEARAEYEKQLALQQKEQEKQQELAEADSKRQKIIIYAVSGGLLLLAAFAFFVVNRLRITRKQKAVIEEQKQLVDEKNKEITDSITYARRIQSAILPPQKLVKQYLQESFILYKPKDIVAGDFYWMEIIKTAPHAKGNHPVSHSADTPPLEGGENHPGSSSHPSFSGGEYLVYFAAADCTGHGVPGAMVSVVCNNALNRAVREYGLTEPGKILDKARELVVAEFEKSEEDVKDGMDISLCALNGNQLLWAGANNPLWLIKRNEDEVADLVEVKPDKQPIGKYAEEKPFTTHSYELQEGDSIYIFSDGFADQFGGPKGKKFKYKPFKELLLSIQDKSMEEQRSIIDQKFEEWRGSLEQIDDVCVIGVRP